MKLIILFIATTLSLSASAFAFRVSEHTQISLLTASPGLELYNVFGHNALRIQDTSQHVDVFFNYGTFDFNTPNFYMKFTRGHLKYHLSPEDYQSFMYTFVMNGQWLKEQVLNFSQEQKQQICDFIENNYKPENRYYRYDFYYDNCATRLRDIIYMACKNQLTYPDSISKKNFKTIRCQLDPYLDVFPWTHMGIDLVMGLPADHVCDLKQEMFLPEPMMKNIETATYNNARLVLKTTEILPEKREKTSMFFLFKPVSVFWMIFALSLLVFFRFPKALPAFQKTWFTLWGILGILITFMWFFTDHQATKSNLNLFWALPTHLFIWLPHSKLKTYYFQLAMILVSLFILGWILRFYPQGIHPAFLPVWLTSIILGWKLVKK
jgi:hypothetical protein